MKKALLLATVLIPIILVSFLALRSDYEISNTGKYISTVTIFKNGEKIWEGSNLITNIGFNATRGLMLNEMTTEGIKFVSLGNVSGVCTLTATGIQELNVCGMTRKAGTVTKSGNNSYIVEATFTATCDVNNLRAVGLHWSSSATSLNNLFACVEFPVINLVTNDQITIRWNITLIEG